MLAQFYLRILICIVTSYDDILILTCLRTTFHLTLIIISRIINIFNIIIQIIIKNDHILQLPIYYQIQIFLFLILIIFNTFYLFFIIIWGRVIRWIAQIIIQLFKIRFTLLLSRQLLHILIFRPLHRQIYLNSYFILVLLLINLIFIIFAVNKLLQLLDLRILNL